MKHRCSSRFLEFNLTGQKVVIANAGTGAVLEEDAHLGVAPLVAYLNGGLNYEHQDWIGTERLLTGPDGSAIGGYMSLPFGDGFTTDGTDLDPYHFAGMDHDYESGLDHAQYREYANNGGHWMSPDPYAGSYDWANPQSFNRYSYALNNPLSLSDPTGLVAGDCPPGSSSNVCVVTVCQDSANASCAGSGDIGILVDIAEFFASLFGGGGHPHIVLAPRPGVAPGSDPCSNAQLNAAGVTAQGQIATAQTLMAAGRAAGNAGPFGNPVSGALGSVYGYYETVHTGGLNDIKNQPGPGYGADNQIGIAAGNISYGVTCPYGDIPCQAAAGVAQGGSGILNIVSGGRYGHGLPGPANTFFDSSRDNAQIRIGQAMRAAGCHE